ncbi:hypothetical protein MP638_000810 [Amoeboaphelidium occidentale]|nr:hypothetical protein MP638_000810 [Amoeboaphelidium occidentale]
MSSQTDALVDEQIALEVLEENNDTVLSGKVLSIADELETSATLAEVEKLPRFLRFLKWFYKWPPSARALVDILLGSGILMIPALVVLFAYSADVNVSQLSYPMKTTTAVVMWSFYLAILWAVYIGSAYLISVLPALVLRITRVLFGKYYVEWLRPKLEYVVLLNKYLALIVAMIVGLIIGAIFYIAPPGTTEARVLLCILIAAIMFFVEKFIVQLAAVSFHEKAYSERIVKNQFFEYSLERLNERRKQKKKQRSPNTTSPPNGLMSSWKQNSKPASDLADSTTKLNESLNKEKSEENLTETDDNNGKTKKGKLKSTPFSFVNALSEVTGVNAVMRGTKGVVSDVTKAALNTLLSGSSSDTDLKSVEQARNLAESIYFNLAEGRPFLVIEDFYPAFPTPEEAKRAFNLLDLSENGELTRQELVAAILYYYQDKRAVERGLSDLGDTVGRLDIFLLVFFIIITVLICLSIFDFSIQSYLLAVSSLFVSTALIVGQSAKNAVVSILFVFVYHPFDNGDKVMLGSGKEVYLVKKMMLTATLLERTDGQLMHCPNEKLADMFIYNLRRSGHQSEAIEISIAMDTPAKKIEQLENKMKDFVEGNTRDFYPAIDLTVEDIEEPAVGDEGKVKLKLFIRHKGNFQNNQLRVARRNKFIIALKDALLECKIFGKLNKNVDGI